jgi:hypothetical protein
LASALGKNSGKKRELVLLYGVPIGLMSVAMSKKEM